LVFPLTIHYNGRMGGLYTLYAESADARSEWKRKLEEAITLRSVIQDCNKVFGIRLLSAETFYISPLQWDPTQMRCKVTCSLPFCQAVYNWP